VSELHPISDICEDAQRKDLRRADIVFVHGLGGDHVLTRRHSDRENAVWQRDLAVSWITLGMMRGQTAMLPRCAAFAASAIDI
jgi:hypothetical protein